jgi:hypothetical protein
MNNIPNDLNIDCLSYCIRGMNDRLINFAKTESGKRYMGMCKRISPTGHERICEFILFYNSVFMTEALGYTTNNKDAFDVLTSPLFMELHDELSKTVHQNFELLFSKLTRQQRRKLQALAA